MFNYNLILFQLHKISYDYLFRFFSAICIFEVDANINDLNEELTLI